MEWGGALQAAGQAAGDSWPKMIDFLRQRLLREWQCTGL
jgi:hypothetical protein